MIKNTRFIKLYYVSGCINFILYPIIDPFNRVVHTKSTLITIKKLYIEFHVFAVQKYIYNI